MRGAVSSHILILTNKFCFNQLHLFVKWIGAMQSCLVGVAFEVSTQHAKLHAFAKQLMGVAHHTYACTQTCEVEGCFTTKVGG